MNEKLLSLLTKRKDISTSPQLEEHKHKLNIEKYHKELNEIEDELIMLAWAAVEK